MTKISTIKPIVFYALFLCFLQCASFSKTLAENEKIIYVASAMEDCVGVGSMKCLRVKESRTGNWKTFYSKIQGFTYVPGFEYELIVRVQKRQNVPADASSLQYILVKEVRKKKK